jgi:hypothetical protein
MMKMRKGVLLFICFLVLITTGFPKKGFSNNSEGLTEVTLDQAYVVANNYLPETNIVRENDSGAIQYHSNFYDIDDSILGYYFKIKGPKDGDLGYMVISATKFLDPVLEYGEGTIAYIHEEMIASGKKAYYLGGLNYYYSKDMYHLKKELDAKKKELLSKMEEEIKLTEKNNKEESKKLKDEYDRLIKLEVKSIKKEDKAPFKKNWENLTSTSGSIGSSAVLSTIKELPVTRMWQRTSGVTWPSSACGPTAGATIANYYKNKRNLWVKGSSDFGGDAEFINHLWSEMSYWWGTDMGTYTAKMKGHYNANHYGTTPWTTWDMRAKGSFNNYEMSIDDNRPVAIRFDANNGGWADYHFVVGIGYNKTSSGTMALVKDPDGGEKNTGTKSFSWSANEQYMQLGFSNFTN